MKNIQTPIFYYFGARNETKDKIICVWEDRSLYFYLYQSVYSICVFFQIMYSKSHKNLMIDKWFKFEFYVKFHVELNFVWNSRSWQNWSTLKYLLSADRSSGVLASKVPSAFFGIHTAITDIIRGIMPAEEKLPRVVSQRDPLRGDLEMNDSCSRQWFLLEHGRDRFLDRLRSGQGLGVHREKVQNVASWK